jgi:PEP-CTERM motif
MTRPVVAAIAIAGAFALLPGLASAQATTAHATLSQYGYQLIDLDPNDGIAPSITFNTTARGALTAAVAEYGQQLYFQGQDSIDGAPASSASSAGGAAVEAWYSASEIGAHGSIGDAGQYMSMAGWNADYTLSANTKLVFTGHAVATVQPGAFVPDQWSSASIAVIFSAIDDDGSALQPYYARTASNPAIPETANFDEWFTLEIVNASSTAYSSQMNILVSANAEVAAPVPEPATYLMLGTGLLLTAAATRRRRTS